MVQSISGTATSAAVSTLFAGAAAIYAPNQFLFSAVAAAAGAILFLVAERVRRRSTSVWRGIAVFLVILCVAAIGYATQVDNYRENQSVFIRTSNGQSAVLRSSPGKAGNNSIGSLESGEMVHYLGRTWRRYHYAREQRRYFEYWREIRVQNGDVGWVYGAYLAKRPN